MGGVNKKKAGKSKSGKGGGDKAKRPAAPKEVCTPAACTSPTAARGRRGVTALPSGPPPSALRDCGQPLVGGSSKAEKMHIF